MHIHDDMPDLLIIYDKVECLRNCRGISMLIRSKKGHVLASNI